MVDVTPIKGGERLQDYLDKLAKKVAKKGHVRVGFLEGATYPDGTPVAQIAAIQNFGAPAVGIPPRPFFSNMVNREAGGWGVKMAQVLERSDYDAELALGRMGAAIAGQLREYITNTNEPPLKPETIKRKGFDKVLIDTGHMRQSVEFEVVTDAGADTFSYNEQSQSYTVSATTKNG